MPNDPYHRDDKRTQPWQCFPANARVEMKNGEKKYVSDVEIGDEVKVVLDGGKIGVSEVWCKAHDDPDSRATYLEIDTQTHRLHISHRHFISVTDEKQNSTLYKMAKDVKVGDYLITADHTDKIEVEMVTAIEEIEGEGVFAPFTKTGNILINGVLVSCYAEVDPSIAHNALLPLRTTYDVTPKVVMDTIMAANKDGVPHVFDVSLKLLKPLLVAE